MKNHVLQHYNLGPILVYFIFDRFATVYRNREALDEVADECRKAGSPDVLVAPHDLAEEQECIRAVQETVEHFGGKRDPSFS